METSANEARAKAAQLLSMLIFGTIGLFVRWIPLPSSVIALVRGAVGTVFLLALVLLRRSRLSLTAIRHNLPLLLVSGAFLGANWILLFEAYRYTTVATATLCYYLAPVFVTLASPIVLRERLTLAKALCVATALLGMALVTGVPSPGGGAGRGVLFGIGAAVLYACIVLFNKKLCGISAFETTIMQLCISAVVLLPYVILTEHANAIHVTLPTAMLLLIVGILHTGVAYALYFGSIRSLSAQTVAIFSYIDPIVAILLSALVLREPLGMIGVIGAVLVLGSTLFSEALELRRKGGRSGAAR